VQSVPITSIVIGLNPTHGEVYSKQHSEIQFVSDLRQVSGSPMDFKCVINSNISHKFYINKGNAERDISPRLKI
jgi:hypothetical protein